MDRNADGIVPPRPQRSSPMNSSASHHRAVERFASENYQLQEPFKKAHSMYNPSVLFEVDKGRWIWWRRCFSIVCGVTSLLLTVWVESDMCCKNASCGFDVPHVATKVHSASSFLLEGELVLSLLLCANAGVRRTLSSLENVFLSMIAACDWVVLGAFPNSSMTQTHRVLVFIVLFIKKFAIAHEAPRAGTPLQSSLEAVIDLLIELSKKEGFDVNVSGQLRYAADLLSSQNLYEPHWQMEKTDEGEPMLAQVERGWIASATTRRESLAPRSRLPSSIFESLGPLHPSHIQPHQQQVDSHCANSCRRGSSGRTSLLHSWETASPHVEDALAFAYDGPSSLTAGNRSPVETQLSIEGTSGTGDSEVDGTKERLWYVIGHNGHTTAHVPSKLNDPTVQLLQRLTDWDFPLLDLERVSEHNSLYAVFHGCVVDLGLPTALSLDMTRFHHFSIKVQSGYPRQNFYHNHLHAADVLQTCYWFLVPGELGNVGCFSPTEYFALLFAAAIHDYDHPRRNNLFLKQTNHPLALLYNDCSILENHHCAACFNLLQLDEFNFFKRTSQDTYKAIRQCVIRSVLATDMSSHFTTCAKFKARQKCNDFMQPHQDEDRQLLLDICLHAADISNPAKPRSMAVFWAERIMQEFFDQGDEERLLGLEISMFYDRFTTNIAECQRGFIDVLVRPFYEALSQTLPALHTCLDHITSNASFWTEHITDMENLMNEPSQFMPLSPLGSQSQKKQRRLTLGCCVDAVYGTYMQNDAKDGPRLENRSILSKSTGLTSSTSVKYYQTRSSSLLDFGDKFSWQRSGVTPSVTGLPQEPMHVYEATSTIRRRSAPNGLLLIAPPPVCVRQKTF